MKKSLLLLNVLMCFLGIKNSAQVGINTTTPDPSSLLDVTSTTKGVLLPRMTTGQRNAISTPATGLLVYDNQLNKFIGFDGTAWTQNVFGGTKWATSGNAGTNSATDFLGTTDNTPLSFRTNGAQAMTITADGQVRVEGSNLNNPRLFISRSNAATSYPTVLAAVNNAPGTAFPVNYITANLAGAGRIKGNYAFANSATANNGTTLGGIVYSNTATTIGSGGEGLIFYTGGHPGSNDDGSRDAMIIGASKNVYIGYNYGSTFPTAKLNITGGDVYLASAGTGVVLTSPNGSCYKVTVDNAGAMQTNAVTCP